MLAIYILAAPGCAEESQVQVGLLRKRMGGGAGDFSEDLTDGIGNSKFSRSQILANLDDQFGFIFIKKN